jgi:hypothetical protein
VVGTDLVAGLAGVVAGALVARLSRRALGPRFDRASALTLVPVALIYPLARRSLEDRPAVTRELLGVAAMTGVAVAARGPRVGRLAAAGWLAHAGFDLLHDRGDGSRLPDWYPAACAGYDAAYAAVLVAGRPS